MPTSSVVEAVVGGKARAVGKFYGGDALASLELHELRSQGRRFAADNEQLVPANCDCARVARRQCALWRRLRPEVAGFAAKRCESAGPGIEAANPVVDFLR